MYIIDFNLINNKTGVIHTDFEKGFIAAEIMSYDDFIRCGTEAAVKAEGKYLSKGREHEI